RSARMMWTFIAYFLAPLGVLVWMLELSSLQVLEKSARMVIGLKLSVGGVTASLPMAVAAFSFVAWICETLVLFNGNNYGGSQVIVTDLMLGKRWRAERNWWILNFNLIIWLTNWRVNTLLVRLREDKSAKSA
ncbi:unnamed protein product, partial [Polarella glacialis]